jgi:hypothetical protein
LESKRIDETARSACTLPVPFDDLGYGRVDMGRQLRRAAATNGAFVPSREP